MIELYVQVVGNNGQMKEEKKSLEMSLVDVRNSSRADSIAMQTLLGSPLRHANGVITSDHALCLFSRAKIKKKWSVSGGKLYVS